MKISNTIRLVRDFGSAARRDGRLILLPIGILLLLLSVLMAFISTTGPLAPFIYSLL